MDNYAKDHGAGAVVRLRSFYCDPLRPLLLCLLKYLANIYNLASIGSP